MKFTGERFIPNLSLDKELEIEHLQRYFSVIGLVKDKTVVDAACGEGYGSSILAEYAKTVYGVDISEDAVAHAQNTYQRDNLKFLQGTIDSLPFTDQSVDIVVSFETIEHVKEKIQTEFLKEVKRILKKDGILVISTPDKYVYSDVPDYKNEFHVKEFYRDEFYNFLRKYFNHVELYYQRFQVTSVISNDQSQKLKIAELGYKKNNIGKYIISLCCDERIYKRIDSLVSDSDNRYQRIINRIIELQNHIEEKNLHIKILQNEIEQNNRLIKFQNARIEEMSNWVESSNEDIKTKNELIESQNSLIENVSNLVKSLGEEVKQKDCIIESQNARIEVLENRLKKKKQIIESSNTKMEEFMDSVQTWEDIFSQKTAEVSQQVEEFDKAIKQKDEIINNQLGHIEQLLVKERTLNTILQSRGWRLLQRLYRVEDFILPLNSKRRFFLKALYKIGRNPGRIIRNINMHKIRQFTSYLRNGDAELLNQKWQQFLEIYAPEKKEVKVIKPLKSRPRQKLIFEKTEKPLVSIVIPVYNQFHYTYSCLQSIVDNTENISYEIIIADDVSTDETINISNYAENITVIRNETNQGFLLNCNNAAKLAKGKYILFLNNDTNVQEDWLKHLVELIEIDETIGMVGAKLVYSDGRLQEAGGIIWKDASGWNYGRLDDPEKPEYNYVKEVDYISGACIMIRTSLWNEIGGFDERYAPAYYEDSDLAFEVRKRGYKVIYQPKSVVIHFEGVSHGTDVNNGIKSYQVKNREKFIEKWKNVLDKEHFDNGQDVFWARDRSRNKKTILVIDHYVPQYDKDAGGRCTYQYLKLFSEMGMNVKFVGDNFFRQEPYTTQLEKHGIEVLCGNWYAKNIDKWIKNNGRHLDYAWLNRPHISIKYVDILKKDTNAKIIYFGHDLHYLREYRQFKIEGNNELLASSERWKKIEFKLFDKADVIHVVGCYEKEVLEKQLPGKTIRNIPLYMFEDSSLNCSSMSFEDRRDILFVGGFNHKPNLDAVIWFAKQILPTILEALPDINFYIVGSNPPKEIKNLQSNNIIVKGFVPDKELEALYNKCRLVVVPLRYGAGVKGKVIEALYHQIPIVTTSIGAEGLENIEQYVLIANQEHEFAKRVIEIYTDKKIWNKLSERSNQYIMEKFTHKAALEILRLDIRE